MTEPVPPTDETRAWATAFRLRRLLHQVLPHLSGPAREGVAYALASLEIDTPADLAAMEQADAAEMRYVEQMATWTDAHPCEPVDVVAARQARDLVLARQRELIGAAPAL